MKIHIMWLTSHRLPLTAISSNPNGGVEFFLVSKLSRGLLPQILAGELPKKQTNVGSRAVWYIESVCL